MGAVRVAIIGVGNCASALVQGVQYYKNAADDKFIPGLPNTDDGYSDGSHGVLLR